MPASAAARSRCLAALAAVAIGAGLAQAEAAGSNSAAPAGTAPAPAVAVAPIETVMPSALRARLDSERGRLVMLTLWATWCTPCLREIPELLQLEREFAASGFVLIGIAMDEPGDLRRLVAPFRDRHFPALRTYIRGTPDMDAIVDVIDPAWNQILPTNYLIGRDGKVVKKLQGARPLEELRALVASQPR